MLALPFPNFWDCRLEDFRRTATRHDKLAPLVLGLLTMLTWLRPQNREHRMKESWDFVSNDGRAEADVPMVWDRDYAASGTGLSGLSKRDPWRCRRAVEARRSGESTGGAIGDFDRTEIVISEDLYRAAEIPNAGIERRNDIVAEVIIRGRAQPVLVRIAQCELGWPR